MKREGEHVKREGERKRESGATRDALARRRTRRAVNDPPQRPCSVTVASSRWSRENVLGSLRLLLCMLRRYSVRSVRGKAKPRAAKPGSFPNFSSPPRSGRVAQAGHHLPSLARGVQRRQGRGRRVRREGLPPHPRIEPSKDHVWNVRRAGKAREPAPQIDQPDSLRQPLPEVRTKRARIAYGSHRYMADYRPRPYTDGL